MTNDPVAAALAKADEIGARLVCSVGLVTPAQQMLVTLAAEVRRQVTIIAGLEGLEPAMERASRQRAEAALAALREQLEKKDV